MQAVVLPLLAALFFAVGQALQKHGVARQFGAGSRSPGADGPRTGRASESAGADAPALTHLGGFVALLRQPIWLTGMASILLGSGLDLQAVSVGDLTLVKPLLGLQAAFAVGIGVALLRERIGRGEVVAVVALGLGAGLVALTASPVEPALAERWSSAGIFAACVLAAIGLAALHQRAPTRLGGEVAFGLGAGLLFGVSDFMMKRATSVVLATTGSFSVAHPASWFALLRTPEVLWIALANLGAFALMQLAYTRGRVAVISPLASLSGTAFVVLLGIGVLGEQPTPPRVVGIVLVLAATALLVRSESAPRT